MKQGDTFFAPLPPDGTHHLFVILSDPILDPTHIVVAPFMTIDDYSDDQEIIFEIEKSDFPAFIRHASFINYDCARAPSLEKILSKKSRNGKPIGSELLKRILDGANESRMIPVLCVHILQKQGFWILHNTSSVGVTVTARWAGDLTYRRITANNFASGNSNPGNTSSPLKTPLYGISAQVPSRR